MNEAVTTQAAPESQPTAAPATAPIQATEVAPAVSFRESLPEDLRNNPSLKNFNDIGGLAKSYVHAQRMIGADKIALPNQNSTDEDWTTVYNKLGRPQESTGYEITVPDFFEEQGFKNAIHGAGLNQNQAQKISEYMNAQQTAAVEQMQQTQDQARLDLETNLKKQFGKDYENRVQRVQATAKYLFGTKGEAGHADNIFSNIILADGRRLGDHPDIFDMFLDLSDHISEDQLEGVTSESAMTPEDAQEEINSITADPKGPYWNNKHPLHESTAQKVKELYEYVHPQETEDVL